MERRRYQNLLRERLGSGQFVASIEFVTPEASDELEGAIAPLIDLAEHIKADARFHTIAITDRVKSDHDHDPVLVGARVAEACGRKPRLRWTNSREIDAGVMPEIRLAWPIVSGRC